MTFSQEELKSGRQLFSEKIDFIKGVTSLEALPLSAQTEIAFAGRSNVGKSSLINRLCQRKLLARTSNTPGRTKELNFFSIGHQLILVDLPGYGYAQASKNAIAQWGALTQLYLQTRRQLRRIFLLIDSRHGVKKNDIALIESLTPYGVTCQIILTKSDKISVQQAKETLKETYKHLEKYVIIFPRILMTSASKIKGIEELQAEVRLLL